jgi:oxygen-dependent protoporphyrinogen oxidase
MVRIAVLGAGISGLAAAYEAAAAGAEVYVYDRAERAGGKLRTTPLDGVQVEEGADAFLVRLPEATELAASVGAEVVHPRTGVAQVFAGGRLRTLPAGTVLGVPGSLAGLHGVLGARGVARAALDLVLPASAIEADPAVGHLVRRRLGSAVLDRMVDPLLGGVYAGSATGLSVRATAPGLAQPERSLLRTVASRRPGAPASGPVFGSVAGGTSGLVDAVSVAVSKLGGVVETGCTATGLRVDGTQWTVLFGAAGRQRKETFDAVVIAVPASPAARLLEDHLPPAALPSTGYASVAIISVMYPAGTAVPTGNGFLVAASERRSVKAITFVGNKWNHPASAPVVIRASVGRYGEEAELQRPDVELAGVAAAEIASLAGILGRPVTSRVTRWGGALPQYAPGHLERVAALRAVLPAGLAVCGAAYDGVGIPACVRSGTTAARAVLDRLGG